MGSQRKWRRVLVVTGLAATALLGSAGCASRPSGPIRAVWVTRFDYKSKEDVVRIMDNCGRAGFNTVLFQVRGNGTAFYDSKLEPWDESLGGRNPGFDPLAVACDAAHRRGLSLQAWVNVMPAWRGKKPPENPNQLYNKRPSWFWYDQHGNRQALSSFYVSLNPCLPEVRRYLVDVFRDIVRRYPVDGLHLDYIRFPNEDPAIPAGSGLDYPRDARTLALFKKDTGKTPDEDNRAWNAWRSAQVTRLMAEIHAMMRKNAPKAVLSTSVGPVPDRALHHFQDSRAWIRSGLVDQVYLMNYTSDPKNFADRNRVWEPYDKQARIVPGLWFDEKVPADSGAAAAKEEIRLAVNATGDFCIFAYSSLFDSGDVTFSQQNSQAADKRRTRRDIVVPAIQHFANKSRK